MSNKKIYCNVCGRSFIFTKGEQKFYKLHNLQEPKKCKICKREESNPYYAKFYTKKLCYAKLGIRGGRNGYFNCFNID